MVIVDFRELYYATTQIKVMSHRLFPIYGNTVISQIKKKIKNYPIIPYFNGLY